MPSQPSDNESDDKHAAKKTDQVIFDDFEVFNERVDKILDDLNQSNYNASTYNENDITSDEDKEDFDAYTPIHDVLEDDIPPTQRRSPPRVAAGAGIAKLQPSFGSKSYDTSRFTTEDYERTSNEDEDESLTDSNELDAEEYNPNMNFL